jgi:hypothetical protein
VPDFADIERQRWARCSRRAKCSAQALRTLRRFRCPVRAQLTGRRIAEEYIAPVENPATNRGWGRGRCVLSADACWIRTRHPGDLRTSAYTIDKLERVPADQIIHVRRDRWPQTRRARLHCTARRLNDMDGYSEAPRSAARGAAAYTAFIKTPDSTPLAEAQGRPAAGQTRRERLRPARCSSRPAMHFDEQTEPPESGTWIRLCG